MRAIYRHLDLLNEPAVLHHRRGFSCRWFEHSTAGAHDAEGPALGVRRAGRLGDLRPHFAGLPEGPRLVAFNPNAYLTFARLALGEELSTALRGGDDGLGRRRIPRFAFPRLFVAAGGANSTSPAAASKAIGPTEINLAGHCAAPAARGANEAPKARLPEGDEVLFVGSG